MPIASSVNIAAVYRKLHNTAGFYLFMSKI